LAAAVPPVAAGSAGSAADASGVVSALAGCRDGRSEEAGFDLGLEELLDSEWASAAAVQAHTRRVDLAVPPTARQDWGAAPVRGGTRQPADQTENENPEKVPAKPYGWKQFRYDFRYVAHKPAHLNGKERRTVLAIAGTTGLLYVYRKDIREDWLDSKTEKRSEFLSNARFMGSGGFAPLVALSAYLASFATHNDREIETAQLIMESMALSGIGSGIGQFVLATERPEDGDAVRFFALDGHGVSFDVAIAASVIPPLRRQYLRIRPGDSLGRKIVKHTFSVLLYSGMVFTALQRIDADKHWAPDVFLGMVTGLGVGRTLGQAHDEAARRHASGFGISPLPGGVAVTWTLSLDRR
jgi:hypothetical protein